MTEQEVAVDTEAEEPEEPVVEAASSDPTVVSN